MALSFVFSFLSLQLAKIDENITDTFKFKKMGNEEQYKHNKKMFVKMREARNQIETNTVSPENISEARKKIVEGMDSISKLDVHFVLLHVCTTARK
jgi:hypothetical protein